MDHVRNGESPHLQGGKGYEVNQATAEELNPQGLEEWHLAPNPNDEIIPGQMCSDREEIPASVDKAEIQEMQLFRSE
ncbi:hypothetical protein [Corynebacterium ulcerans]|uniref:hypothetical protein n=1 Tax=Corynebacterium ulcerans TaxID=65058 RepID=UPI0018D6CE60|nr:hypothetical protein [Corynebacterium ulcerans]MBH5297576.1 hypothetical protein [Corynebacterium ulcerans]MBH5302969.1 hypothetical protein [Corynebacterium ulcerans]